MAVNLRKRETTEAYLSNLTLPAGGWTAAARGAALARLQAMGLPHGRDEYWRFTRPDKFLAPAPETLPEDGGPSAFAGISATRLVFTGDRFDAGASDDLGSAELLSSVAGADIHWARELYGTLEARGQKPVDRPLAALNTAFATEGMLLRVSGKTVLPVEVVHRPGAGEVLLHHVIKLDPGAELTLLETGTPGSKSNLVIEVEIGDGAAFHHIRLQGADHGRRGATHLFARLGDGSLLKSFTLSASGEMTRNEAIVELLGDGGSAHVAGVAMGGKNMHHDDTVFVTHDAEGCESRQVFKKVLRSGATGVFQGKILVTKRAQKTDGYQISQSLLLDDDAQFLAKPELEIYADDVKCSHGSTSGAIDEEALYYLRSRGVPKAQAERLLVRAFLAEAADEIAEDRLRDLVLNRLDQWLDEAN